MKKQRMLVIFFSIALLLCCSVILSLSKEAFAFTLPDTGQTMCYQETLPNAEIACAGTGQDGEYNINPMSYTDNGNGTITDNVTGLMWQKEDNNLLYSLTPYYLESIPTYCYDLSLDGVGWRLPTKKELLSLVDYGISSPGPAINTTYFPNTNGDYYWSSVRSAYYGGMWAVGFANGTASSLNNSVSDSSSTGYIRCVRGNQSSRSFKDNGNGIVTDNITGLEWQQGDAGGMTRPNAILYCEGLSLGGQTDWRLPNIKELDSITDDGQYYYPAIDLTYFPNTNANNYYWSSTTTAPTYTTSVGTDASAAWIVIAAGGVVSNIDKFNYNYARCVRGGHGSPLCSFGISPSTQTFTSTGGTGSVAVTALLASSCTWATNNYLSWVTITSGSGTGSGTATFTVAENTTGAERTGNITIADKTFTITQSGAATCTYTISPNQSFTSASGTSSITVTASGSSCAWTAVSNNTDWIRVPSGATGTGSGTATISWSANTTGAARTATITIAGKTSTITQSDTVFADVVSNYGFYNYIKGIYDAGVTRGCAQNPLRYCSDDLVTRGAMAAFIIRSVYGENFTYTLTPYYSDVPATHGFFKYVQKMRDAEITLVTGSYGVDREVNRGSMAAFIIRAKYGENFTFTATPYYSDVTAVHGFFKYVQKMKDAGITAVTGNYMVGDVVTRGAMAAFLARAFLGIP